VEGGRRATRPALVGSSGPPEHRSDPRLSDRLHVATGAARAVRRMPEATAAGRFPSIGPEPGLSLASKASASGS